MTKTLYVIHGWAYSVEPWSATIEELKKRDVDVVMLRVPGLSTPSDAVWTIDDYVSWLDEQFQNIENPIVLGHSNGGRIAMHYLVDHPGRFKHLILLASAGIELNSQGLSMKRKLFRIASRVLAPLKKIPILRKTVHRLLGSDYGNAPSNMKKTLANMLASDRQFDPSSIDTQTTLLYGDSDTTTPPAMGQTLADSLPNSKLKIVQGWRHAPYKTHPAQLANEIAAILEDVI